MSPSSSAKKKAAVKAAVSEQSETSTGECVHHWVIDPPNGAVSQGRCKTCGEEKEFRNSFEYSSWYGNKSPGAKGGVSGPQKGAPTSGAAPISGAPAGTASAAAAPGQKTSSGEKPAAKKSETKK